MIARFRLLLGISVFWLALSMIVAGINTLVLPIQLLALTNETNKATTLGSSRSSDSSSACSCSYSPVLPVTISGRG